MEAKIPASHKAATLTRLASKTTETPCIGICSTIYGDYVCRGCFRSAQEVVDWNGYNTSQKLVILNRLNQTITQVLQTKLLTPLLNPTFGILLQSLERCRGLNHRMRLRKSFGIGIDRAPQFPFTVQDMRGD